MTETKSVRKVAKPRMVSKQPILAVDIGGTHFRVALVVEGRIVDRIKCDTQRSGASEWMVEQIKHFATEISERSALPIAACGIGFGGPVNFKTQRVVRSMHAPGWSDVPLAEILAQFLGVPCIIDNDANVAALGEFTFGAGQGCTNLVYYTVSTGIGGGLILNGKTYRGSRGLAGELGHVPINPSHGPTCTCGKVGCLEAYCSGDSISRRATERINNDASQADVRDHLTIRAKDVFAQASTDLRLSEIIDETAQILGAGIAGVCNILDPDRVVIGGAVAFNNIQFIQKVRSVVNERLIHSSESPPTIVPAALRDDSVLLGAAALVGEVEFGPQGV